MILPSSRGQAMSTKKRSLSGSSSEDAEECRPQFKRPRSEGRDAGRRESAASTASSSPGGEAGELDRDSASLDKALDWESDPGGECSSSDQAGSPPPAFVNNNVNSNGTAMFGRAAGQVEAASAKKFGNYSSAAERMMAAMGYQAGSGLGRAGQGRVEPVQASTQRGRRGLGLVLAGLEADQTIEWNTEDEVVEVEEKVVWLPHHTLPIPPLQELRNWCQQGPRKEDISDEAEYCDQEMLTDVLNAKNIFDRLEPDELMKSRTRSNPFETIRGGLFLNRAAMKMANLDAICDFMFTEPVSDAGKKLVGPSEPLYFADVCSGPGGFSEYVLWKKRWKAKGFGFTLRNTGHDFKLEDFYAGPPESFEPHYGVGGVDGDGNVFSQENIDEFSKFVLENTGGKGVHFMMADGGFSVEGQENIQEILSKQLYLCQCLVALSVVRPEGHFVCKLFDLFTPFSVGLVYMMYRSFQSVAIHKPNTSRPANSERYIICKWKRPDSGDIRDYLAEVNRQLSGLGFSLLGATRSPLDVVQLVPDRVLAASPEFTDYMRQSNNMWAERQVLGLTKIAAFCKNETLHELRQAEIRSACLEFWRVPDDSRRKPMFEKPKDAAERLLGRQAGLLTLACQETLLEPTGPTGLKDIFRSIYDWRAVVVGAGKEAATTERTFILGLGRNKVYMLDQASMFWRRMEDQTKFELSPNTLLYGEVVKEFRGEGKSQRKVVAVHIIDGFTLGGEEISSLHFQERHDRLKLFLHTMNKASRNDYVKLRLKTVYKLEDLGPLYQTCNQKLLKGGSQIPRLVSELADTETDGLARYFQPAGLLFYKTVREPFMMALSKSANKKYFFNTLTKQSAYELPPDSAASFGDCHRTRAAWYWGEGAGVLEGGPPPRHATLTRQHIERFVESKR